MRKWMRDRLQRRKKQPAKPLAEAAPAPLQPAFYGIEPTAESPRDDEAQQPISEPASQPPEVAESGPQAEESQPGQNASAGDARRRRRRRGRGRAGRGGTASRTNASAAQVPAAPPPETGVASQTAPTTNLPEPQPGAAGEAAALVATPRPSRGTVVLAIGLPGSGKSSWFKRHNITPLSSDLLRSLLFDDPTEQRFQDLIFSNLRSMLKARLIAHRPMNYVDATNLTSHDRHAWIKLAKDYGYDVQAVFFDVPLEVCLERNRKRDRVVGEDVMRRMSAKLKPPKFEEGFSKITVVKVKQKET
jgi:predicted kinase